MDQKETVAEPVAGDMLIMTKNAKVSGNEVFGNTWEGIPCIGYLWYRLQKGDVLFFLSEFYHPRESRCAKFLTRFGLGYLSFSRLMNVTEIVKTMNTVTPEGTLQRGVRNDRS